MRHEVSQVVHEVAVAVADPAAPQDQHALLVGPRLKKVGCWVTTAHTTVCMNSVLYEDELYVQFSKIICIISISPFLGSDTSLTEDLIRDDLSEGAKSPDCSSSTLIGQYHSLAKASSV